MLKLERAVLLVWALASLAACERSAAQPPASGAAPTVQAGPAARARLPAAPGRFAPAFTELAADAAVDGAHLADVDTCAGCHPDAAAQWESSAHAASSFNNPVYRVAIERLAQARGHDTTAFCGGCHDPALLVDGALAKTVATDDLRAHVGISCRVCHGIEATTSDGNGSYRLSPAPLPIPERGDDASVARHVEAARARRDGASPCVACHRSFLSSASGNHGGHIVGMDEAGDFLQSGYAGTRLARVDAVERRDCVDCHMPKVAAPERDAAADADGMIASHRFLGGHTWLSAMRGDAATLEAARRFLRDVASIDIASIAVEGAEPTLRVQGAALEAGQTVKADVVVRNLAVGHRFPGGVRDAADTFVEFSVIDAAGRTWLGSSGERERTDGHALRAIVLGADARPRLERETHEFSAPLIDHTLPPRAARAVRFTFIAPRGARHPLTLRARLLHRTRNLELQRAACRDARSERGRAFARASERFGLSPIDACVAQPITEVAATEVQVGRGSLASGQASWRSAYEYGLALMADAQDRVWAAEHPLEAALHAAAGEPASTRGMLLATLAEVAALQDQSELARERLNAARALLGDHPALDRVEGELLSRTFRFEPALAPLSRAATATHPGALAAHADALLALGRDARALETVGGGLDAFPRDTNLLRIQALSLRALERPEADAAIDAWLATQGETGGRSLLRARCVRSSALCRLEHAPLHEHALHPIRGGRATR